MRHCAAFFYADYGLFEFTDPVCMQEAFNTLTGMFGRLGIKTNFEKTVRIIFRPLRAAGTHSETAYEQCMTGEGLTYRERQRVRVQCSDCGE